MGHRAAERHLRARVQQVAADDDSLSVSTRATSAPTTSSQSAPSSSSRPSATSQVRRLEFAHDVLMEENFDETEAGEVGEPLWESHVHDLSWYDSEEVWEEGWDEYDGFGGYVRMVAEVVEPADHELLEDVQSECGSSCSLPSTSTLHFSLCDEDEVDSQCELASGAESDWVLLQQARAEEAELCVRTVAEGHEVILDSGADVTVLPMHIFGEVASKTTRACPWWMRKARSFRKLP